MANPNPRGVLLTLLLIFILFSPDTRQPTVGQQFRIDKAISHERAALDILNSTAYGALDARQHRWLNLTGLRQADGYAWELLDDVRERARRQSRYALGPDAADRSLDGGRDEPLPLYHNLTGYVLGKWARAEVSKTGLATYPPHVNLSAVAPAAYTSEEFHRNITGRSGDVRIRFNQKDRGAQVENDTVREISAHVAIKDETSFGDGWELDMHGVHFLDFGGVILTTTSEKFAGIFALPHFALSEYTFSLAQKLLNRTIPTAIRRQESALSTTSNPWGSSSEGADGLFPIPHCEIVLYLQQTPVSAPYTTHPRTDQSPLQFLEHELRAPTGYPFGHVPEMSASMLAFSPDCGFVLESVGPPDFAPREGLHLQGPKFEVLLGAGRRGALGFAAVLAAQIVLTMRQMREASTPSTRSRISFYSIAMLALGDGFACMAFLLMALFVEAAFLPLLSTAFFAFLSVSFFGMRFLMDLWAVQAPERRRLQRQQQQQQQARNAGSANAADPATDRDLRAAAAQSRAAVSASPDTLPLPATARAAASSGATPIVLPSDQDIGAEENATQNDTAGGTGNPTRRELGTLYTRFYFILLGTVFLSLHATSWPPTLRSAYANLLSFVYLSFWVPQIYRNVYRNCRKALRWEFVVGQSLLRFLPFAYFLLVPSNVFFVQTDRVGLAVFAAWLWLQFCALLSQELLGPRFFVPRGWAPPAYDYHPVLREDEEGATLPVGFTLGADESSNAIQSPSPASPSSSSKPGSMTAATATASSKPGESKDKGKRVYECAICMQTIEAPVLAAGANAGSAEGAAALGSNILARRAYMVTPCRHIFHTPCLEGWMRYRLQCPICREALPAL